MKTRSVFSLLIVVLLFVSITSVAFATTSEFEFTVSPGETLNKQIKFDNVGVETAHNVIATEYGTATQWTSFTSTYLGDVAAGKSSDTAAIQINVPENVKSGESYELWYSFTADEGYTGAKIHITLTVQTTLEPDNNDGDNDLEKFLQDNWIWILIATGVILTVTGVALTKKRRKPSEDNLVSNSPSSLTAAPVEITEQVTPPPPPDFSPDIPPPPPLLEGTKSEGEKHLEKIEDQLAEESRLRRGQIYLTDEEEKQLLNERPPFLSKYDTSIDPRKFMFPDPDPNEAVPSEHRKLGGNAAYGPPFDDYKQAAEYAKYRGMARTIPKSELGKLSAEELDAYNKWQRRYSSYLRRRKRWWNKVKDDQFIGYAAGARG